MLMDNGQMPQVQTQDFSSMNTIPTVPQSPMVPVSEKDNAGLIKTIIIIVVSLIAVTFVGLFIWMFLQYNELSEDVKGQIDAAVTEAKDEQAAKMEAEFSEREKYPYRTFSGPADYGELTFEYPKTWSVYVAADASNGGDYTAYFNPVQVDTVGRDTINALRLVIRDKNFDDVASEYQRALDRNNSGLTVTSITFGKNNDVTGNRYSGKIPNTDLNGYIVIFKIRDKTAILQTDSVYFQDDFDKLINTITFNA